MPNRDGTGPRGGGRRRNVTGGCQRRTNENQSFRVFDKRGATNSQLGASGLSARRIISALSMLGSIAGAVITAVRNSRQLTDAPELEREIIDITPEKRNEDKLVKR